MIVNKIEIKWKEFGGCVIALTFTMMEDCNVKSCCLCSLKNWRLQLECYSEAYGYIIYVNAATYCTVNTITYYYREKCNQYSVKSEVSKPDQKRSKKNFSLTRFEVCRVTNALVKKVFVSACRRVARVFLFNIDVGVDQSELIILCIWFLSVRKRLQIFTKIKNNFFHKIA